jgi:DNA-directed RNA polymerase specialized sigma24 family protein
VLVVRRRLDCARKADLLISASDRSPHARVPAGWLGSSDLLLLLGRCETAAAQFVRRMGLPTHERDDVRQDLLLDVLKRIKAFDPGRGSLGAFIGTIIAHRTARLAKQVYRQRALHAEPPNSPTLHFVSEHCGLDEAECDAEIVSDERIELTHLRLDLKRSLQSLSSAELALCRQLIECAPAEIHRSSSLSRASIYRRINDIRMRLLMTGFAAA